MKHNTSHSGMKPASPSKTVANDLDLFNRQEILKRLPGSEDLLTMLIESFVLEMPKYFTGLQDALDKKDSGTVFRLTHTIKGSAANLSCKDLKDVARTMEEAAKENRLADVQDKMPQLLLVFDRTRDILLQNTDQVYQG